MTIKSINPFNNELLEEFKEMTTQEVNSAIGKADEAYKTWKKKSFKERAKVLFKVSELYLERKEELAQLMALEMGKKVEHGIAEIELVAYIFKYYAEEGENLLATKKLKTMKIIFLFFIYSPFFTLSII